MKSETPLDRACRIVGNGAELGRALGITRAAVSAWRATGRVPPKYALQIERLTLGAVTRHDMRPDLYPDESFARAPALRSAK